MSGVRLKVKEKFYHFIFAMVECMDGDWVLEMIYGDPTIRVNDYME
jgi:hypothetical protein